MGGQDNCDFSGLSTRFEGKWWGHVKSTSLFPELTLEELVSLMKYYSVFLLQQEAASYEIQL